ncbi:MAG: NYN domain-containing protein [Patescibacteria group bacterium]
MEKKQLNNAYLDGANLHQGIRSQKWILDYRRFRIWLEEKYAVKEAYLFIGLIPKFAELYKELQEAGYILVFKEVVYDGNGKPKGNCDADLVVQAMQDHFLSKYEKAIIVSSDGDYASLVKLLMQRNALECILSPAREGRCSILLKKTNAPITYLGQVRSLIESVQNKKAPGTDGTVQGSFS